MAKTIEKMQSVNTILIAGLFAIVAFYNSNISVQSQEQMDEINSTTFLLLAFAGILVFVKMPIISGIKEIVRIRNGKVNEEKWDNIENVVILIGSLTVYVIISVLMLIILVQMFNFLK